MSEAFGSTFSELPACCAMLAVLCAGAAFPCFFLACCVGIVRLDRIVRAVGAIFRL